MGGAATHRQARCLTGSPEAGNPQQSQPGWGYGNSCKQNTFNGMVNDAFQCPKFTDMCILFHRRYLLTRLCGYLSA